MRRDEMVWQAALDHRQVQVLQAGVDLGAVLCSMRQRLQVVEACMSTSSCRSCPQGADRSAAQRRVYAGEHAVHCRLHHRAVQQVWPGRHGERPVDGPAAGGRGIAAPEQRGAGHHARFSCASVCSCPAAILLLVPNTVSVFLDRNATTVCCICTAGQRSASRHGHACACGTRLQHSPARYRGDSRLASAVCGRRAG